MRALLRRDRRLLGPALIAVFASHAYFIGPPAWNQNSRFALTRALVESRTTAIDPYHHTTGDKSWREGHFYSDKAPGASLLALPIYAALYGVLRAGGGEFPEAEVVRDLALDEGEVEEEEAEVDDGRRRPGERLVYNQSYRIALYLCRLLSTSLLAVLGVAALYLLALRQLAGDRRAALAVALTYGLATPAFVYGSALYGHQLAADFLLLGFAAIVFARGRRHYLAAGTCLGWAVLCEYPAAIPVVLLVGLALALGGLRGALWTALGGLPWAGALGLYHWAAFGSPLKTGYDFVYLEEFAEGMEVRYGIGPPDPAVLLQLLFGTYRGLFTLAPVLLLAAWGLVRELLRRGQPARERLIVGVALAICAHFLLLNAGYYMWDGGAALGPRHCVPMLPFLALGLGPALREAPRVFVALAAISAGQMILAAAGAPEAPQHGNPIWGHAWPRLRDAAAGAQVGATNLGLLLGLPGVLSLGPLALLWLAIARDLREGARALAEEPEAAREVEAEGAPRALG
ncbi:MAG: hypothetical protein H6711_22980 [Myxococcales bacterium]|nr:hypothetical protein [Myxococcales bacterium]